MNCGMSDEEWTKKKNELFLEMIGAEKKNLRTKEKNDSKMVDQLRTILEEVIQ